MKKIKIIKTDNHGVSHARNIGLDNMTGDYVVFVDSDDYIGTNMFYTLIEYVNKYKVDMVLYDSIFENSSGEFIKIVEKNITPNRILNKKEIVNNVLSWMYGNTDKELINNAKKNYKDLYMDCYNAPWQAMYKKSLIEDLRFDERLNIYEDLLFNVQIITKCNSLVYIDSALYHYVCNSSGSLATMYHSNYIEMKLLLYDIMKKILVNQIYRFVLMFI
ncbi:glycosyltransferase [Coprobacillaceae bacterium CR2/5/TPMF4]|nr:glycosyltransferase [Coprobacillaceae bacterium CR2/5/TPMF4]